jgi:hypothetical protein
MENLMEILELCAGIILILLAVSVLYGELTLLDGCVDGLWGVMRGNRLWHVREWWQ